MVSRIFAGITLQAEDAVHFGALVRIRGAHIGVTTDGRFKPGQDLEFQLDLVGQGRAVRGAAEVVKADLRDGSLNRYLLRIRRMRRDDQARLAAWCEQQAVPTATSSRAEGAPIEDAVLSAMASAAGPELPPAPAGVAPQDLDSFSLFSISSRQHKTGTGRAAIRAVLRSASGEPIPFSRGQAVVDPIVAVELGEEGPRLEVHYATEIAWRRDWDAWLHQGLLFVPSEAARPALDQIAQVLLTYAGRLRVACGGRVVLHHPRGFGIALEADPAQLQCLDLIEADPDIDPALPMEPAAPPPAETASPAGQRFWRRLFGLPQEGTLEAALAALPSPLAPLEGLSPRQRRRLDSVLEARDKDYLELCEEVTPLLRVSSWRWKELEQLAAQAQDPEAEAAAWIVLAHVARREAIDVLRQAGAGAAERPVLVRVQPGERGACLVCARHVGKTLAPIDLARRGLPPFHLGCDCRVMLVEP